jgi:hypothetical protein
MSNCSLCRERQGHEHVQISSRRSILINIGLLAGLPEQLCHATTMDGRGWTKGRYTKEEQEVSCKRCLQLLAKRLVS